jgi:hypothetical protein
LARNPGSSRSDKHIEAGTRHHHLGAAWYPWLASEPSSCGHAVRREASEVLEQTLPGDAWPGRNINSQETATMTAVIPNPLIHLDAISAGT